MTLHTDLVDELRRAVDELDRVNRDLQAGRPYMARVKLGILRDRLAFVASRCDVAESTFDPPA